MIFEIDQVQDYTVYGNDEKAWPIIPGELKPEGAIVYSYGVGANIVWDEALIDNHGCKVWGFDPTPKTIGWANQKQLPVGFEFHPVGLSYFDGYAHFKVPENPDHISYVAHEEATTDTVKGKVNRLQTTMNQLGHIEIDVLKMNILGCEYPAIDDFLSRDLRPKQLLIRFHHDMFGNTMRDTHKALVLLYDSGYRRYYKSQSGRSQAFLHHSDLDVNRQRPPQQRIMLTTQSTALDHDRGVVYFAFGKEALNEAILSRRSLRASNPDLLAAIFTDMPGKADDFDIVHQFSDTEEHDIEYYFREPKRMPSMKVRFLRQSPFCKTIHLDCDTYVKGSLDEFFKALDEHDIILTNMPELEQSHDESVSRPVHQSLKSLTRSSAFSCAVFGYRRSPNTDELLHTWWTQFVEKTAGEMRYKGNWGHTGGVNEQGILHQMLADGSFTRAGVKRGVLPNVQYNAGMSMWPRLKDEGLWEDCRILHSHAIMQEIGKVGLDGLPDLPQLQKFR